MRRILISTTRLSITLKLGWEFCLSSGCVTGNFTPLSWRASQRTIIIWYRYRLFKDHAKFIQVYVYASQSSENGEISNSPIQVFNVKASTELRNCHSTVGNYT
jgi:hypothetical protein